MSTTQATTDIPIACSLTDTEQRDEQQQQAVGMFKDVEQVVELEDGYAFGFAVSDERASELFGFIQAERKCCPFFTFELIFEPAEGPVWLRLRGAEGVKEFVREAFYGGQKVSGS